MGLFFATLGKLFGMRAAPATAPARAPRSGPIIVPGSAPAASATRLGTRRPDAVRVRAERMHPRRPLRVVHRAETGRIVISGRMADVCAELERLAALESAQAFAPAR